MKKYRAALSQILYFLTVCCEVKIPAETLKQIMFDADVSFKEIFFFPNSDVSSFILFNILHNIIPKLILDNVELLDIPDSLDIYLKFRKAKNEISMP